MISAGIPDIERLITDSILTLLIFPVLLPSLRIVAANHVDQDIQSDVVTSLYLLCCILRIVKIKDLANIIVAALYYPLESLTKCFGGQVNGMVPDNGFTSEGDGIDNNNNNLTKNNKKGLVVNVPCSPSSSGFHPQSITMLNNGSSSNVALRYLADQLTKVQIVNEVSKDFVIEALRSIAELITYGDQHDPSFFEFFMENQVVGDFVRVLKLSRTISIPLQLLQTVSIMIQNLQSEHAIYYMLSNEHMNFLITYSFDFRNEELLSYYISFLSHH